MALHGAAEGEGLDDREVDGRTGGRLLRLPLSRRQRRRAEDIRRRHETETQESTSSCLSYVFRNLCNHITDDTAVRHCRVVFGI